ncbi:right-handed parallel beta-helix repeat-containing protein [Malonomonas rubra]|uniref:right-handed parallel beta-helix repeat-containing protein n=1 Tax=Malonomonas rubra TaxID=57040 RepID=UPI0026EC2111|nr:right-handed parallel beta-helix repeat-containing protein [Malonomonas rubra]
MKNKFIYLSLFILLLSGCAATHPVTKLDNQVIDKDTRWQGNIFIRGLVTVKKGALLEIEPGTRIFFEPLDNDGDGIGDGELLIEGSLYAVGTEQQPILLTSGAKNPRPRDWKFLYLDFAQDVEIAHLISEYAYSGVQIHFCRAKVTASEFRYNVDGVRFSTVNIDLTLNNIHHNQHGIRYEERQGSGWVHHNRISENQVGIFAVTKSDDRTLFEKNNIENNREYQIKLGIEQKENLSFPRNWWGELTDQQLAEQIFDRHFDPNLGQVTTPLRLKEPVQLSL